MKQNITLEDIKGLDTAIFVPLIKNGHIKHEGLFRSNAFVKKLTIGKMMEVLDNECIDWMITPQQKPTCSDGCCFEKEIMVSVTPIAKDFDFFSKEPCDALFQALCYVLEKEV